VLLLLLVYVVVFAIVVATWKPAGAWCRRCHRSYDSDEVDQLLGSPAE
jgi:hypothetical protein